MSERPKALDLYCSAGGSAMGLHRAGFEVTGIDNRPQKRFPFTFRLGDALEADLNGFDFVWASPPCLPFTPANHADRQSGRVKHPDLIAATRDKLSKWGGPWIMENVGQAPLRNPCTLCGLMFGLKVFRHRAFESNLFLMEPPHPSHAGRKIGEGYFSVAGGSGRWKTWGTAKRDVSKGTVAQWREAMQIPWMVRKELVLAVPPAYALFLGRQVLAALNQPLTAPAGGGRK